MIAITFDTDYMSADDLARFVDEFPLPGRGTFFLWQPMPGIRLGDHELGLHPMLADDKPWGEALDRMIEAHGRRPQVVRAHSCAYSHYFGVQLARAGVRAVSQATYLFKAGLEAYRQPWGVWELPIYYMDSMDFTFSHNWPELRHAPFDSRVIERSLHEPGLYVYDFHPLHLLLNTSSYRQYQRVREEIVAGRRSPFDVQFAGRGCRTFYLELVERMEQAGVRSSSCGEALQAYEATPTLFQAA